MAPLAAIKSQMLECFFANKHFENLKRAGFFGQNQSLWNPKSVTVGFQQRKHCSVRHGPSFNPILMTTAK
jgi:hypothetical protein